MPIFEKPYRIRYKTSDEIEFLEGLGSFCAANKGKRSELLLKYLKSMRSRVRWDEVDYIKVRAIVKDMIKTEFPWMGSDPEMFL